MEEGRELLFVDGREEEEEEQDPAADEEPELGLDPSSCLSPSPVVMPSDAGVGNRLSWPSVSCGRVVVDDDDAWVCSLSVLVNAALVSCCSRSCFSCVGRPSAASASRSVGVRIVVGVAVRVVAVVGGGRLDGGGGGFLIAFRLAFNERRLPVRTGAFFEGGGGGDFFFFF